MIIFTASGQKAGAIQGKHFIKRASGKKHFLRKPRSIAIDLAIVKELEKRNVEMLVVHDGDDGKSYYVALRYFLAHALCIKRGHGEQRALLLIEWQESEAKAMAKNAKSLLPPVTQLELELG